MIFLADWLQTLGQSALGAFWLPLVAWTAVALAVLGLLRLWPSAHFEPGMQAGKVVPVKILKPNHPLHFDYERK